MTNSNTYDDTGKASNICIEHQKSSKSILIDILGEILTITQQHQSILHEHLTKRPSKTGTARKLELSNSGKLEKHNILYDSTFLCGTSWFKSKAQVTNIVNNVVNNCRIVIEAMFKWIQSSFNLSTSETENGKILLCLCSTFIRVISVLVTANRVW